MERKKNSSFPLNKNSFNTHHSEGVDLIQVIDIFQQLLGNFNLWKSLWYGVLYKVTIFSHPLLELEKFDVSKILSYFIGHVTH